MTPIINILLAAALSAAPADSPVHISRQGTDTVSISRQGADSLYDHSWSLEECVSHAVSHNISIRQSEISLLQRENELNTQKNRRLPAFSASASENLSFGRGLTADNTYSNANTTSTSFSLGGEIPIFQGFDISNGIKLGQLSLEAATQDLEKAKDDVQVNVAQAYVEILYNLEMMRVAQNQEARDKELLDQVQAQREVGKSSAADVAAQQATLAQSRLSLTQAQNNYSLAVLSLTQLLELPTPEGFSIVEPPVEDIALQILDDPQSIYDSAVESRPAVLSAELNLKYAQVNIARAKGAFLPTLSLNGGIGTNFYTSSRGGNDSFGRQLNNNFSQYVGLSLNVPIFARLSTRNSVRDAKLSFQNQQLQVESVKKSLYQEIQQAYYNAVAAQSRYFSAQESARSAQLHYELTGEKYSNGLSSITEYNEAKNSYLSAESDFVRAKYECLFQTKLLDFYKGEDIIF